MSMILRITILFLLIFPIFLTFLNYDFHSIDFYNKSIDFNDILFSNKNIDFNFNDTLFSNKSIDPNFSTKPINLIDIFDDNKSCVLPQLNPWDYSIRHLFDSKHNPMSNCTPTNIQKTFLTLNGTLILDEKSLQINEECFYRCVFYVPYYIIKFSNWTQIIQSEKVECEVVETECRINDTITYNFVHLQVVEKDPHSNPNSILKSNSYSLNIILLDSVSMSSFKRSLPQTIHYLQTQMDAILFPYLNKIGYNSRPNSYGFLMGQEPEAVLSQKRYKTRSVAHKICKTQPVDNLTLFTDFRQNGYETFFADDYTGTLFTHPHCIGLVDPASVIDHQYKQHNILMFKKRFDKYRSGRFLKSFCIDFHEEIANLFEKFLQKYENKPTFSISWFSHFAHSDPNDLFHADKFFIDYFERLRDQLSNSFVIFMADHGNNYGEILEYPIGQIERNNPFLAVIVPEKLRKNKDLMMQLNENSKQLVTHFDLYATFLEIAENSRKWTSQTQFSKQTFFSKNHQLLGSSLFHPLKQPRNCKTLHIPFDYCLCQVERKLIKDPKLSIKIAQKVVNKMNRALVYKNLTEYCVKLEVNKEATIQKPLEIIGPEIDGQIFVRAELEVKPSGGLYEAYAVIKNGTIKLLNNQFPRSNSYGEQSKCIPSGFFQNYCYCKDLLNK